MAGRLLLPPGRALPFGLLAEPVPRDQATAEAKVAVEALLGEPMVRFHQDLARLARDDPHFHFHYVTARETYNLGKAAEAGWQGSVAAALDISDGAIRSSRVALGGVAHKPWRAEVAEKVLRGQKANAELFDSAAREAIANAKPYQHNKFKVEMARRAVARALANAAALA